MIQFFRVTRRYAPRRVALDGISFHIPRGQFVFLSGRPYRWNHAQLRANVEYILGNFFFEGVTVSTPPGGPSAGAFQLYQNFPNPFAPSTIISFYLPKAANARVTIFDPAGREVAILLDERVKAGLRRVPWNGEIGKGRAAPSGVYFYRVEAGPWKAVRKMTLAR